MTCILISPSVPVQPGPPARSIWETFCVLVTTSSTGAALSVSSPLQPNMAAASAATATIIRDFVILVITPSLASAPHDAWRDEDEQLVMRRVDIVRSEQRADDWNVVYERQSRDRVVVLGLEDARDHRRPAVADHQLRPRLTGRQRSTGRAGNRETG